MTANLESPRQLAQRTGWPERRIRNLIANGKIRHIRIGCNLFIPPGAIEEFLKFNMVEPIRGDAR
jgi:excisionase family DNA binding protein